MTEEKLQALRDDLKTRLQLLARGILPPKLNGKTLSSFVTIGVGAGPQGKTFYVLSEEDQKAKSMISIPIFPEGHNLAKYAIKTKLGDIPGTLVTEHGVILKSVIPPNFFNKSNNKNKLLPIMRHCYGTATSVLGFDCKHFSSNDECKFCEIVHVGKNALGLPEQHSTDELFEAIKTAIEYDKISTVTITSGTFTTPDEIVKAYIKLLKKLKHDIDKPIKYHVQHEPISDTTLFKGLAEYADSVGIFLEIFDEAKRKQICPGKAKISLDHYKENWREAVKHFGKGNVMSTCLLGFDIDYNHILEKIEEYAQIGVKTSLLFVRVKSKNLKDYVPTYLIKTEDELVDLFIKAAGILTKYGLSFQKKKGSGCIGCQGCTGMTEANEIVKNIDSFY